MPAIRTQDTLDGDDFLTKSAKIVLYVPKREANEKNALRPRTGRVVNTQLSRRSSNVSVSTGVLPTNDEKKLNIVVCGVRLRPTVAFDTFWRVAAERKAIDDRRRAGLPAPWTNDVILRDYFFCNTFRVLDKVSQYIIKEVIEKGSQDPEEVTFRVLLFNSFTKIETWELLDRHCGPLRWKTFDHAKYMKVLEEAHESGQTLYTSAFIKPAPSFGYKHNFANHLCLLQSMMENKLAYRLLGAQYMANVYEYIISFPSMGPFSTYQLMLCLSYTNLLNFHQDDFVISGPGSQSGLNKLFGKSMNDGRTTVVDFEAEVMRYMANTQDEHFKRLGLQFSGLGPNNLPMSIADIEHTLCEVDKYCRVAHPQLKGKRTHITRNFKVPEPLKVGEGKPNPAVLPKAWSHPNRRTSRIRPEKTLLVEKRYEVKRIDGHRDTEDGKQYFVYWVGYPDSDATWEFESSLLEDAPAIVQEYLASLKIKKPSKKRR